MKNYWTDPKVKTYPLESGKDWYIWFRFNGGNPTRVKLGLNKIPDYNERLEQANLLAAVIRERLEKGWTPDNSSRYLKRIDIIEAINYGYEQKKLHVTKNTSDNLKSSINFFIEGIKKLKLSNMLANNFERFHAKKVMDYLKAEKQWKNKNYNKHLGFLRSIFAEIVDADYCKINPFNDIRNLKEEVTIANIPPTDDEMKLICDHLQKHNYGFYVFYMIIYYCGIRPDEVRQLRIKNLDFENECFNLPGEITKNGKFRSVPMLGNIKNLLKDCQGINLDYFVFGTWVSHGGRHSQKNWFSPNPYSIKEDTPNKQWNKLIKNGLGINKTLYSAKHKGADDKHAAGMDIKTICDIFGHSETKMTERYMHSLSQSRLNEAKKITLKIF